MILHQTCSLRFYRTGPDGTTVTAEETIDDLPIELTPLNSKDIGIVVTEYQATMTVDPQAIAATLSFVPTKLDIMYEGGRLQIPAGFERHQVLGRFHHVEFVVSDFGKLGGYDL